MKYTQSTVSSYDVISISKQFYAYQILLDETFFNLLDIGSFLGRSFSKYWISLKNVNILNLNELNESFFKLKLKPMTYSQSIFYFLFFYLFSSYGHPSLCVSLLQFHIIEKATQKVDTQKYEKREGRKKL